MPVIGGVRVAPPRPPRPPRVDAWPGLQVTWTGWDGSRWDVTNPDEGVFLFRAGLRGLGMPDYERPKHTSPVLAGSRLRRVRALDREVLLPLIVYSDTSSRAWMELDSALWRSMDPERPGSLRVTSLATGSARTLDLRFVDDGGKVFDHDPHRFGWTDYAVKLEAQQPFWRGDPIVQDWGDTGVEPDYYSTSDNRSYVYHVAVAATLDSATLTNPGDEPSYPVWTLRGPFSSAVVGVGEQLIDVPVRLAAGQSLTIDTHPDALTMVDEQGQDRTEELGDDAKFAAVEPGESVVLSLSMVGAGDGHRVVASIVPLYRRAW